MNTQIVIYRDEDGYEVLQAPPGVAREIDLREAMTLDAKVKGPTE